MPPAAATGPQPSPQAAYAQWIDACASAGWRWTPTAEQAPVRDALGRVTAAPLHARWPAPRSACAAMDGIAAQADLGMGQRARTGAAVTRPSPARTGTGCGVGTPRQPAVVHAAIHWV